MKKAFRQNDISVKIMLHAALSVFLPYDDIDFYLLTQGAKK